MQFKPAESIHNDGDSVSLYLVRTMAETLERFREDPQVRRSWYPCGKSLSWPLELRKQGASSVS
jgi:hypothetical protein